MGSFIVKLDSYYLEWSTVVDAPVTLGVDLESFKVYYREMYGEAGMRLLDERLKRVEEKGTSSHLDSSVDELILYNRAGPDESCLTKEEIIKAYCKMEPINGWKVCN